MKEFFSLKILDRFRTVFEHFGCDYNLMRKILQVKLTMDSRRVPTILNRAAKRKSKAKTSDKNNFIHSLWIYAFLGVITVPFVLMNQNYMYQMSTTFAILMFLIMTSMISDFSAVLLDIRDRAIISTKPVGGRTVAFAKTVHVMIYLFLLTGSLASTPLLAALIGHGILFFLLFLLGIISLDILVIVLTALLYLLILNFFDGERLKDIINYIQIILSIAIVVGFQFVGRSFEVFKFHIVFHSAWWQVVIPPFWYGALFESVLHGHSSLQFIVLSILAFVGPVVLFAIYLQFMPTFEGKLQKLSIEGTKKKAGSHLWLKTISKLICVSPEERVFFQFASLMIAKDRLFKLKVYPSLGFSMVLPFIIIFNPAWSKGLHGLSASNWYLSIYCTGIIIPTVVMMLKYSGQYKGAWVYKAMPIFSLAKIFKGAIKAFLTRLFLPIFFVESAIFVAIFGMRIIPGLFAACLSMLLYTVICFRFLGKGLPFSRPFATVQARGTYIVLPLLLLISVFIAIHVAVTFVYFGMYVYIALLLLLNGFAWWRGFRMSWAQLLEEPVS